MLRVALAALAVLLFASSSDARPRRHISGYQGEIVAHPAGCPRRAFCGCGASIEVFGRPIRELFLAANWFKFPRAEPAPGMVAVRRGHVFVLRQHVEGKVWLVFDANSGGHKTRVHHRSIAGLTIVNPHGSSKLAQVSDTFRSPAF